MNFVINKEDQTTFKNKRNMNAYLAYIDKN